MFYFGKSEFRLRHPLSWKWFGKGAIVGVLSTIPLVMLCALLFRFPVPFAGYLSGFKAVIPALLSLFFYGVLFGGLIIQGLLGGIGGLAAEFIGAADKHRVKTLCIIFSTVGASIGVFVLAILDKIIGPW